MGEELSREAFLLHDLLQAHPVQACILQAQAVPRDALDQARGAPVASIRNDAADARLPLAAVAKEFRTSRHTLTALGQKQTRQRPDQADPRIGFGWTTSLELFRGQTGQRNAEETDARVRAACPWTFAVRAAARIRPDGRLDPRCMKGSIVLHISKKGSDTNRQQLPRRTHPGQDAGVPLTGGRAMGAKRALPRCAGWSRDLAQIPGRSALWDPHPAGCRTLRPVGTSER